MSNSIKLQIRLPEPTSWNFPSASATACSWERPSVWRSLLYRSEDLQIASVVPSWTASPCWSSHFCTKRSDCCSCSPSQLPFASVVWIAGPIQAFCCSKWKIFRCFWILNTLLEFIASTVHIFVAHDADCRRFIAELMLVGGIFDGERGIWEGHSDGLLTRKGHSSSMLRVVHLIGRVKYFGPIRLILPVVSDRRDIVLSFGFQKQWVI